MSVGLPNRFLQSIYVDTAQVLIRSKTVSYIAEPRDREIELLASANGQGLLASLLPKYQKFEDRSWAGTTARKRHNNQRLS